MCRLTLERHPSVYALTLFVVGFCTLELSDYAATSRGYPPPDPFSQHIAPWLGFFGLALPPFFEDWQHHPRRRRQLLAAYAVWGSLILGVISANAQSRPSIGHLTGYFGVVTHCWPEVLLHGLGWSVIVLPFVFCYEALARGTLALIRRFPDTV